MAKIELRYGTNAVDFEFDDQRFEILGGGGERPLMTDSAVGDRIDDPIDSKPLEEIVGVNESVLIVVPDATRATASGQIVNLIVRRLIANGTMPHEITCIFSTGIHRAVTEDEKRDLLTPFIYQRIKHINHEARNLAGIVRLGETSSGIPIELSRSLVEHDHVILVGGITFHYFAGFSGGRKLVCPGLASSRTISETHKLAFDFERKTRRSGVGLGVLDGNAVHEGFVEVVDRIDPAFCVSTFTSQNGQATGVFAGNWKSSHRFACDQYLLENSVEIAEKREVVIVSCGGSPSDINMIQAHKAFEMASRACLPGGKIIWLAECGDGLGRSDFLKWFEAANSEDLAEKLCAGYQVNGQTAWSLLKKAELFDTEIISLLPESATRPMRLHKAESLADAVSRIPGGASGYILPYGSKSLIAPAKGAAIPHE